LSRHATIPAKIDKRLITQAKKSKGKQKDRVLLIVEKVPSQNITKWVCEKQKSNLSL